MQTSHQYPEVEPANDFDKVERNGWTHTDSVQSELPNRNSGGRAALLEFAWNIRDIVTSNIEIFDSFTPNQMKEFAVNMASAFEKFTLELEVVTEERDGMRRELIECTSLLREREKFSLHLSSKLAEAHAKIATQIQSLQLQLRALCTALVLNSSCMMSVILPNKCQQNVSPVIHGIGSLEALSVSLSAPIQRLPWPVSHFCVSLYVMF
jgi:hypothetical protein